MAIESKINGSVFEKLLQLAANRSYMTALKIPEGCRRVGKRVVPIKSPFDFIITGKAKTLLVDAKTTLKDTFSYSDLNQHQLAHLRFVKNDSVACGYVICMNKEVYFFEVDYLLSIKPKASVKKELGIYLGNESSFKLTNII